MVAACVGELQKKEKNTDIHFCVWFSLFLRDREKRKKIMCLDVNANALGGDEIQKSLF
jgi:hypothetical protein